MCVSQTHAGAIRGSARRDYARLPGAWLTEETQTFAFHEKRGPGRKEDAVTECWKAMRALQSARTNETLRLPALRLPVSFTCA